MKVQPIEHDRDCRGTPDVQGCARCAELWRRIGGGPQHDPYARSQGLDALGGAP